MADKDNNRIQEFTARGRFLRKWGRAGGDGTPGNGPGQFSKPYGVAVGCGGDVYVSDEGSSRIQVFGAPCGPPASCQPGH